MNISNTMNIRTHTIILSIWIRNWKDWIRGSWDDLFFLCLLSSVVDKETQFEYLKFKELWQEFKSSFVNVWSLAGIGTFQSSAHWSRTFVDFHGYFSRQYWSERRLSRQLKISHLRALRSYRKRIPYTYIFSLHFVS